MNFSSSPFSFSSVFVRVARLVERPRRGEERRGEKVKQRNYLVGDSSIIFSKDGVACLSVVSLDDDANAGARKCRKKEKGKNEGRPLLARLLDNDDNDDDDEGEAEEEEILRRSFVRSFVC